MNTELQDIPEINVQKMSRDEAYNIYASNTCLKNRLLYLNAELNLAKLELNYNQLKESRNTCWRVIERCRSNMGYGKFYDEVLISYWIDAYLILGDMFYLRGDRIQARECYEKADDVLMEQLNADNTNIKIIYKAGICKTKLGCLLFKRPYYQNSDRYLKDALSLFSQIRCTDSNVSEPKYVISCPIHLDGGCKYKFSCTLRQSHRHEKNLEISEFPGKLVQIGQPLNEEEYDSISKYISLSNFYLTKTSRKLSEPEKLTVYRNTYTVLKSLLDETPSSENILNIYDLFLEVGNLKKQNGDISAATDYYDKGMRLIHHHADYLLEHIVLQCECVYNSNMSLLRELTGDIDAQDRFADFAVCGVEKLHKNYPSPDSCDLLGEIYLALSNSRNKYAERAIDFHDKLSAKSPVGSYHIKGNSIIYKCYRDYSHESTRCRRDLLNRGLITHRNFPTTYLYPCKGKYRCSESNGLDGTFMDEESGIDYIINLSFVCTKPISDKIECIEICKVTLNDRLTLTHLQLCEDEGMMGTRPNPTPDEFIEITYADTNRTKVRYQRCYG